MAMQNITEMTIYTNGVMKKSMSGLEIIESYLSELTPNTQRSYRRGILDFFQCIYKGIDLNNLTPQMLVLETTHAKAFKEELANKGVKANTINARIKAPKAFYEWLITQTTSNIHGFKVFEINPFIGVKQETTHDAEGSEPLSPEEVVAMLESPEGHNELAKMRNMLILELAISTGIRNTALLSITMDDITKIGNDWVVDTIDKGGKRVKKAINNYYDQLMEWYEADKKVRSKDNGTIFNISTKRSNDIISDWAKRVTGEDKKITFHSLRTTTACQVYHQTNGNIDKAQVVLNHSNRAVTFGYLAKENKVDKIAENLVENMKQTVNDFASFLANASKEDLVKAIMELDETSKAQIFNALK